MPGPRLQEGDGGDLAGFLPSGWEGRDRTMAEGTEGTEGTRCRLGEETAPREVPAAGRAQPHG